MIHGGQRVFSAGRDDGVFVLFLLNVRVHTGVVQKQLGTQIPHANDLEYYVVDGDESADCIDVL